MNVGVKNETMEILKEIIENYRCTGKKFVDKEFLEVPSSPSKKYKIQWLRPCQIACGDPSIPWTVFRSNPQPSDVKQGELGNCWFIASLSSLAGKPDLLKRVMITKEVSEAGVYVVELCKWGRWHTVIIDDLLPCDEHGCLTYAKPMFKQLWPCLIEKALAKFHGSYSLLTGGKMSDSFAKLTGAPRENFIFRGLNADIVWNKMKWAVSSGYLIGTICVLKKNIKEKKYHEVGLTLSHCYSVLNCKEFQLVGGKVARLVQLRDTKGFTGWIGDWSDYSYKWEDVVGMTHDDFRNENKAKGIFWINIEDFLKFFYMVVICKVATEQEWKVERLPAKLPDFLAISDQGFDFSVNETSEVDLSLFYNVERSHKDHTRILVDSSLSIFHSNTLREKGNHMLKKLVMKTRELSQELNLNCILEPGHYRIVCLAFKLWLLDRNGEIFTVDEGFPTYSLVIYSKRCKPLEEVSIFPRRIARKESRNLRQRTRNLRKVIYRFYHQLLVFSRGSRISDTGGRS